MHEPAELVDALVLLTRAARLHKCAKVRLRYGLPWLLRLPTLHLASYFCAKAHLALLAAESDSLQLMRLGFAKLANFAKVPK